MLGALKRIKRLVTLAIGMPICMLPFLRPYKRRLLSTWINKEKFGPIDRLFQRGAIAYWFEREYLTQKDPDVREAMNVQIIGEDAGVRWADHYGSAPIDFSLKIGTMTYEDAQCLLPVLDKELTRPDAHGLVAQIGCSSGREIAWLARRHPGHRFIGTDIYPEVVAHASRRHRFPNLSFELCSAKKIVDFLAEHEERPLHIISSGSLQYVQPEHLALFFKGLAKGPDIEISLIETSSDAHCDPDKIGGSIWQGSLAYTHDYRFYAEAAGMKTFECRIIKPFLPYEKFPMHRNTVFYFYRAKSVATKG